MYDVNDELQRLLQHEVDLPDLSDTTYDTLAQRLPHQADTGFDARPESPLNLNSAPAFSLCLPTRGPSSCRECLAPSLTQL